MILYNVAQFVLQYTSVSWNSITVADSSIFETAKRIFAILCCSGFLIGICYNSYDISAGLNLSPLQSRQPVLNTLLLITIFKNKLVCSFIFYIVSLHVPITSIRDFLNFHFCHHAKTSLLVRCISVAQFPCICIDIFNREHCSQTLLTEILPLMCVPMQAKQQIKLQYFMF
jgi:hypothetical protein